MKYKSVVVTKRGGPEVLKIVENDLREPAAGEVRMVGRIAGIGEAHVPANRPHHDCPAQVFVLRA